MVGGTTFRRRVIHGEIPESWSFNLSGEKAVLTHRPGYFCLDNAFALIEGHPAVSVGQCSWKSSRKDGQVSGRPCCSSRRFRARIVNTDVAFENRCVPRVTASSSSPASSTDRIPRP